MGRIEEKEGERKWAEEVTVSGPEPTTVDLTQQQKRPGLGPAKLDMLDLQKEFVGLHKPVISLDYPSPEGEERYKGADLTGEQVKKCKEKVRSQKRWRRIWG